MVEGQVFVSGRSEDEKHRTKRREKPGFAIRRDWQSRRATERKGWLRQRVMALAANSGG
jgi:hypothetical protein